MNLLVKKIGLVLLPALFFACEDPTELGANLNPNTGAVSVLYEEIDVTTSQVRVDSALTSASQIGPTSFSSLYLGRVDNPEFGTVKATIYTNLGLPQNISAITLGNNTRLDSVKLQLVWNNRNVFGSALNAPQLYDVYRLTEPISPTSTSVIDTTEIPNYRYYANNKEALGEQLGQLKLNLSGVSDKLDSAVLNDVNKRTISARLDESYGQELFQAIKNNTGGIKNSNQAFEDFTKGLAIVPQDINTFLTTYNITDANAGVFLYYTQGTEQKVLRLPLHPATIDIRQTTLPAYFGLEVDRSGTGIANSSTVGNQQTFESLDQRVYFQGLTGLYPRVEFNAFKDFLLGLSKNEVIAINRAVLEFDSVFASADRQPIPRGVELYVVDDNNRRIASTTGGTFERALSSILLTNRVGTESVNYYQSDIAYILDQYIRTGEDRYLQAILYPANVEPNQFVIKPNQVKLKIWYTKLERSNL